MYNHRVIIHKEGAHMDKKAKQASKIIIFLCWAAYTAAYIGRLNYNAYIVEIISQLGTTKEAAGLVSSFFFFSYGAGQLVHGILSRKYNTRYSVAVALIGSALVNVGMTLVPSVSAMKIVWLMNGVFQSILWSSLIKTLSDRLPDELLSRAVVVMSTPAALGTFLAYGLSSLFSAMRADYRWVFYVPAILLAVIGALWFLIVGRIDSTLTRDGAAAYTPAPKKRPSFTPAFIIGAVFLLFAAISNGFIKDGVTTWTPSILNENFHMPESLSILITLILPLIAIFGAWLSTTLHKRQKNTSVLNGLLYFVEAAVLLLVIFTAKLKSPVVLIVLFAGSAMLMSAVNNVITSIIPMYMRDRMDSGLLAGVLDTFCYVGSTLSTWLLGRIADVGSWNGVFICLLVFGAVACVLCWLSVLVGRKKPAQAQSPEA